MYKIIRSTQIASQTCPHDDKNIDLENAPEELCPAPQPVVVDCHPEAKGDALAKTLIPPPGPPPSPAPQVTVVQAPASQTTASGTVAGLAPRAFDRGEALTWWNMIFAPGQCVELRGLLPEGGTVSGYFDDPDKFLDACARLFGKAHVYTTINPVPLAFMARGANVLRGGCKAVRQGLADKECKDLKTTADADIKTERLLIVDVDPDRPEGVSATNLEFKAAGYAALHVQADLRSRGVESGVMTSGNGFYVIVRLPDAPMTDGRKERRRKILQYLSAHHSGAHGLACKVDVKVANPSRIMRVPGTLNIKGEDAAQQGRAWRMAQLFGDLPPVSDLHAAFRDDELDSVAHPLKPAPGTPAAGPDGQACDDTVVGRARRYLAKVPPAVSGENGHDATYRAAMILVQDFNLPLDKARTLLQGWNRNCRPPWDEKDLEHKLADAMKNRDAGKTGCLAKVDRRAETSAQNGAKGGRPPVDFAEIAQGFAADHTDPSGNVLLRLLKEQWYQYRGSCYARVQEKGDVERLIMDHLHGLGDAPCTDNAVHNVKANLNSTALCGTPSHYNIPFWLPDGTSAVGWMPMAGTLVNVHNLARQLRGETVLQTDVFRPPTPRLFVTYSLPYAYDPKADCPKWKAYLADVQPDPHDQLVLQKLCGLALDTERRHNVFFILLGEAGTGKSVFCHVLQHLLGTSNCCVLPLCNLRDRFGSWMLTEFLANIVSETDETADGRGDLRHVEGLLKMAADYECIHVEHKFNKAGDAPAIALNIFATNSLPHFSDRSQAIWDRLRVISFDRRFRGTDKENLNLRHEIVEQELAGVFTWAVEGLAMLLGDTQFPEHSKGIKEKNRHREKCDPERLFLEEQFERGQEADFVESRQTYQEYRTWTELNGYHARSEHNFADSVRRVMGADKRQVRAHGCKATYYFGMKKAPGVMGTFPGQGGPVAMGAVGAGQETPPMPVMPVRAFAVCKPNVEVG